MSYEIEMAVANDNIPVSLSCRNLENREKTSASSSDAEQQGTDKSFPPRRSTEAGVQPRDNDPGMNSQDAGKKDDGYPTGMRLGLLTFGLMAIVLMVALDNYILATAIPKIATEFHGLDAVAWYASAYFLTQMAFQPTFGHLFSDFSVTKVCVGAILVFEIGSIVCAVARNSSILIIGRLVAGAGGAGLYVGTLTFVGSAVPVRKRPLYLSFITSMFGVASVAGPLLGGVFTDSPRLTWRFCFWINLPIGLVAFIFIALSSHVPKGPTSSKTSLREELWKLNPVGVSFLISGFVCLQLALQWAGIKYPWSDSRVWGCLLGFGLLISAFFVTQIWKKENAQVAHQLVSQRTVAASSAFLLFISMIVGQLIYYLPLYFQTVRGATASESGIRNLPFLVTMLFAPMISGALINVIGYYVPFMWLGAVLATIGSGLLFSLRVDTSNGILYFDQFLAGLGLGLCTQISFTAVQYILPKDQMVMGSALVSFCNSLGPILGTNIGQAIFTNVLVRRLEHVPDVDAAMVVIAGPTNLAAASKSPMVIEAFSYAITKSFIVPIVAGSLAFCCSCAMEWGNVKQERKHKTPFSAPLNVDTNLPSSSVAV